MVSPAAAIQPLVSRASSTPAAPRARPLADLPVEALAARAGELARSWALALVLARPPDRIGEIPMAEIAQEAPSLCAALLRALASDEELARLTGRPGGREGSAPARRLAALAGARDAAGAAAAAEALRGVLWEELVRELRAPAARQLGDAGDRLAHVCAAALAATLEAIEDAEHDEASPEEAFLVTASPSDWAGPAGAGRGAVIVDERAPSQRHPARADLAGAPPEAPPQAIEIRDQRGGEGPAAWIGAIGSRLEAFRLDGLPFAVLLAEITNLERLRAEEGAGEADRLARSVERLLAAELGAPSPHTADAGRGPATITCERPGRYWLLAPRADRIGADELAERLAVAAASIRTARGRSAALAIGTASCPQDGREAAALAAHADVGLYAARAASRMAVAQPSSSADRPA